MRVAIVSRCASGSLGYPAIWLRTSPRQLRPCEAGERVKFWQIDAAGLEGPDLRSTHRSARRMAGCRNHLRNILVDSSIDAYAHLKLDRRQSHADRAAQLRGCHALSRCCVETPCSVSDLDEIAIGAVRLRRLPGQNSLRPAWLTCDLDNSCSVGHGRRTHRAGRFRRGQTRGAAHKKRVIWLTI